MIYNNEQNNVNELFNNDFGYKSDDAFYSNNSFDDNADNLLSEPKEENSFIEIFKFEEESVSDNFYNKQDTYIKPDTEFLNLSEKTEKTNYATKTSTNISEKKKKGKIFSITKEQKKDKKMLGRKRLIKKDENENENNGVKHSKYDFDNVVRKIKSNMFDILKNYLNKSLKEEEGEILPKEKQRKRKIDFNTECFLKIEQNTVVKTNVNENLELLNLPLRDIFSRNVSEKAVKFSSHGLEHNKYFIEQLKHNERKKRTNEILDMTFLQCLKHVRGSEYFESLRGLEEVIQLKLKKQC